MKELLPRERFIRTLRREPVDRVTTLYRMKAEAKQKIARVFGSDGQIMPGLYAAGEAAGFGGGGMHGYRSLEGTFLGGCLFSGRNAGRAAAKAAS